MLRVYLNPGMISGASNQRNRADKGDPVEFCSETSSGQNLAFFCKKGVAHKILLVSDGVLCPCESCTVPAFEQEAQHGTGSKTLLSAN